MQAQYADGVYGPRTVTAVKNFQRDYKDVHSLDAADGIAGLKTREALEYVYKYFVYG